MDCYFVVPESDTDKRLSFKITGLRVLGLMATTLPHIPVDWDASIHIGDIPKDGTDFMGQVDIECPKGTFHKIINAKVHTNWHPSGYYTVTLVAVDEPMQFCTDIPADRYTVNR
jgi:hypothetical protein